MKTEMNTEQWTSLPVKIDWSRGILSTEQKNNIVLYNRREARELHDFLNQLDLGGEAAPQ